MNSTIIQVVSDAAFGPGFVEWAAFAAVSAVGFAAAAGWVERAFRLSRYGK